LSQRKKFSLGFGDGWPEEETFGGQMKALNVEVIRPQVEWCPRRRGAALKNRISIGGQTIYIGKLAMEQLKAERKHELRLRLGAIKNRHEVIPLFKLDESGYKVTVRKDGTGQLSYGKPVRWLLERGVTSGRYSLKKVDGGFIGIPERS
jgi:hypothetical protein